MKISKYCLRYIVPFSYHEDYDSLCGRMTTQENFEWKREHEQEGPESDLFRYVRNEFLDSEDREKTEEVKLGTTWRYQLPEGRKKSTIRFFEKPLTKDLSEFPSYVEFSINDAGILLFRNQLGFLWYEVTTKKELDDDTLVAFQNIFKELNRAQPWPIWEVKKEEPPAALIYRKKVSNPKTVIPPEYLVPFSMGEWIAEKLAFLNPEFLPDRKNAYDTFLKINFRGAKHFEKTEHLEEYIEKMEREAFFPKRVPDKAILFTFGVFSKEENISEIRKEDLVYYLANGYKDSYQYGESVKNSYFRPFESMLCYATQEGCAYLAWPEEKNRSFYNDILPSKIKGDYFTLYLKCLFQSYSLFLYARKIQDTLSAVPGDYFLVENGSKIASLFCEINLFLTKTMAASVSHIHHQTQYYLYIKKQLRIVEDVESVTSGLDAMESLLREIQRRDEVRKWREEAEAERIRDAEEKARDKEEKNRDDQMQKVLYLFSFLTIFSALTDGFDFASKFIPLNEVKEIIGNGPAIILYGAFFTIIIWISYVMLKGFFTFWKKVSSDDE